MDTTFSAPSTEILLQLYDGMLKSRVFEERMIVLLKQGRLKKWFSGIGQEAISIGTVTALEPDEFIFPLIRNLGIFLGRDMPLESLMAQLLGKASGFTLGRDRSFHFGSIDHAVVGMISHLGPQLSVANGVALSQKLRKKGKVTVAFSGDGGTSEGEFHEALNLAAVWDLPVIFIIESNQWAISTPAAGQYRCKKLSDRALGYGIKGLQIDGNNVVEVYQTVKKCAEEMRFNPHPVLIECITYRVRGHEEASGIKYVPSQDIEEWKKRDPLLLLETMLQEQGILGRKTIETSKKEIEEVIDQCAEKVLLFDEPKSTVENELADVYAEFRYKETPAGEQKNKLRFVDSIREGLFEALEKFPELILMGQDIGHYGGVFKVTDGLAERFGVERIRDTPLCESAPAGAALGLSLMGHKVVLEIQYADFVSCAFTQIVNNLAKIHYRWGAKASVVIRMPTGAGIGAGPFHSQSTEAWFAHVPGLKIAYPSTPEDAKGLLLSAIEDPNPIIFYEQKLLYRSLESEVPEGYYTIPFGKARIVKEGDRLTVITYGLGVIKAKEFLDKNPDLSVRLVDLRTLIPWDKELVSESVERTSKVIILHEDTITLGFGAEIAAYIAEHCFQHLDAPIVRCASLDTPVPFSSELEKDFLPFSRFEELVKKMVRY
jgi:2-oxoisovalerate dehydrogenase E1 component